MGGGGGNKYNSASDSYFEMSSLFPAADSNRSNMRSCNVYNISQCKHSIKVLYSLVVICTDKATVTAPHFLLWMQINQKKSPPYEFIV